MRTRAIAGHKVSAIGLGAMPMSLEGRPDEDQSIRTIHAALDGGVTFIDTADAYCINAKEIGHNERLIAKAISSWPGSETVHVATKGGHTRPGDGSWQQDGRPEYLKSACEASLRALGAESIWLYQYHRPDPKVPFAEAVGALNELQDEGKIQFAGLSNVSIEQIDEASEIIDVASVQNEFSAAFRDSEPELRHCAKRGIAFLPWSPLGGIGSAGELGDRHQAFSEVADECGVSPQQVALAWELAMAGNVVPIPGASRPETIRDSLGAAELHLSDDQLRRLQN
ncbi:MAG TPA: aldo/keto reductase [Actinomycetota bacterium]|nr:aldo/keto reductase [Actinomycetota bacterium]